MKGCIGPTLLSQHLGLIGTSWGKLGGFPLLASLFGNGTLSKPEVVQFAISD